MLKIILNKLIDKDDAGSVKEIIKLYNENQNLQAEIIKVLVDAIKSNKIINFMHYLAIYGEKDLFEALIQKDISIDNKAGYADEPETGLLPLHMAVEYNRINIIDIIMHYDVQRVIQYGRYPNDLQSKKQTSLGRTPEFIATTLTDSTILKSLQSWGSLEKAIENDRIDIIDVIMEADIKKAIQERPIDQLLCNQKNMQGITPKQLALFYENQGKNSFNRIKEWELKFLASINTLPPSYSKSFNDPTYPVFSWKDAIMVEHQYGWVIHPTAQIVEIGEKEEVVYRFCTGFNIGDDLFLTAGHCLANNNQDGVCYKLDAFTQSSSKYRISFNYQYPKISGQRNDIQENLYFCTKVEVTGTCKAFQSVNDYYGNYTVNKDVDFAILRIEPTAQQKFGQTYLNDDYSPKLGDNIVVAHHAGGRPKKLSEGKIVYSVSKEYTSHDGNTHFSASFNHTGLTHGGSSGAPIGLSKYESVVGIHVAGNEANNHIALSVRDVQNQLANQGKSGLLPLYQLNKERQRKYISPVIQPSSALNYRF